MAIPLISILIFGVFVAIGVWYRRRPEIHRPMMLLATLSIVAAATDRITGLSLSMPRASGAGYLVRFFPPRRGARRLGCSRRRPRQAQGPGVGKQEYRTRLQHGVPIHRQRIDGVPSGTGEGRCRARSPRDRLRNLHDPASADQEGRESAPGLRGRQRHDSSHPRRSVRRSRPPNNDQTTG